MKALKFKNDILSLVGKTPKSISIETTTRCPLDCVYCDRALLPDQNKELNFGKFEIIKDKIANFNSVILCGIGETFSNPSIYDYVNALSSKKVVIVTSGTIEINVSKLDKSNSPIDAIIFSVDASSEEKIKQICGKYNYKNLINNLKNIRKEKINTIINTVINNFNVNELEEMAFFMGDNRVNVLSFELPVGEDDFVRKNAGKIKEQIKQAYRKIKEQRSGIIMPIAPNCTAYGSIVAQIDINGYVYPCCDTYRRAYKAGNIYNDDFSDIWEGEVYKQFRQGEHCKDCSFLKNYEILYSHKSEHQI